MSLRADLSVSLGPIRVFIAIGLVWGSFAAVVPPMKAQIGAPDGLYGLLMLSATLGAVLAVWLGPLARRLLGRWALSVGLAVLAAGFATVAHVSTPFAFAAVLFFAAMGTGVVDVLANADISEAETRTGRALMNLNHAVFSFAFAGAAMSAGLARQAGAGPVLILGCVAILAVGLGIGLHRADAPDGEAQSEDASGSGTVPFALTLLAGTIVMFGFMVEAATEGWSALFLERVLEAMPAQAALGPALFGLMMGVGRFLGYLGAGRIPELRMMGLACALSACGFVLVSAAPSLAVAALGFALAGLGVSVVAPLALGVTGRSVPPKVRLVAISRVAAMGYAAFFFGPPLMGGLAELFGLRVSFFAVSLGLFGAAALLVPALSREVAKTVVSGPR